MGKRARPGRKGAQGRRWADVEKDMKRKFGSIPRYSAQFGVDQERSGYRYKKQSEKPRPAKWDNMQVLFNGLMNQGRNPIFTTNQESARIMAIWVQFSNLFIKTGREAHLKRGAGRVSEEMIKAYRMHMMTGVTKPGRPAKLSLPGVTANKIKRGRNGNWNYSKGPDLERARIAGYGVDTGKLWKALRIGVRRAK